MLQGPTSTTIAHRRRHDILPVSLQRCHGSHRQRQRPTANTITVTGRLHASGKGSSQADNVIHKDRSRRTFEAQLPHRFRFNQHFDCAVDAWRDQDLLPIRLVTKMPGKIRHRADGSAVEATFKTDSASCGVCLENAHAKVQLISAA